MATKAKQGQIWLLKWLMPEVLKTDYGYAHFWWLFPTIEFALPAVHKYGIYLAVCAFNNTILKLFFKTIGFDRKARINQLMEIL